MEIDLELPSLEQEKSDPVTNKNVNILEAEVGVGVNDGYVDSPKTCEHAMEDEGKENATAFENDVDSINVGIDVLRKGAGFEPNNGMEFDSKEAAYSFYREYARSVGFGITIKASRRSKSSGKFIDVKIACSRFGSKRQSGTVINPRPCIKTGCKAGMHMKRKQDEKWIVHSFIKEHNHEICPDDFYCAIRGGNKQPCTVAYQRKGLQLALDEKDIQLLFEHFMCMQDENPDFFYAIDLDHEMIARSVFWVDAKGRHDYIHFSDVVFFDTFYIRNKYKIPCIPIVGVNHHFQYMLLGCALIGDLSTSAIVWLMQTWLKAVGGQAPELIITDQDKTLNEAVQNVFPNSGHSFCLWHILGKMSEILGDSLSQDERFMAKFKKCVFRSWTDEQFEKRWGKIVEKFELKENEWILSLYEDRKKWVPAYMRNKFLAGMSTTERSGSVASFFDKYMDKGATFTEFIEQYKLFLHDSYEMEATADFETLKKQPALRSLSTFEKQMSLIYTDTIFKKFQFEAFGVVSCHLQKETEDEANIVFWVDDSEEHQNFFVSWNKRELDVCCLCHSFEYRGFLCKHAIFVLQTSAISEIPSHYILKRWTKDAKIRQNIGEMPSKFHYRVQRFNHLCRQTIKLVEQGSVSQEAYTIAFEALEEAVKHCVGVNNSVRNVLEGKTLSAHGFLDVEEENHSNSAAKSSKGKKIHKKRKVHSEPEGITIGLHESCQEIDLGSRASIPDGYYGSQPNMQGVGQLNANSPVRDGYYGSPQTLLALGQLSFRAPNMHSCFDIPDSLQDAD
ncbi:hypothetical protein SLA2020_216470 [Shorea laevis]